MAAKRKFAYQALDVEMQRQILTQRLQQIEAEHFNHATNRELVLGQVTSSPEADRAKVNALAIVDNALAELERAHHTLSEQIGSLEG